MAWSQRFGLGFVTGAVLAAGAAAASLYAFGGAIAPLLVRAPAIPASPPATASAASRAAMEEVRRLVAEDDRGDFADAERGFVATRADAEITGADGEVVFDLASYDFLKGEAPPTVNPSLWRHAQILTRHGLFPVAERIWQVRGFDISTVSFIDAGSGWIVVDPLTSAETAKAAFDLVTEQLGAKPVIAVIYSHSHADHYGGVGGVITAADAAAGRVQVIAPEGFLREAISENILAGPAMLRRARFQFGITLPRSAEGELTSGLGPGVPNGTRTLIAPTDTITHTGQKLTIGDLTLVFQVTPGAEAPAEMNFHIPNLRALFMAENANLTMHNLLPARGALVRDAKAWADYLTESMRRFGEASDVMFAAHGVPRFGQERILEVLGLHRDAYKFLHDQSVRLMNAGLTGSEIAEVLRLPDVLAKQWFNRGYYGTLSHNAKAVYQRYMGWYDANPANLWPLPPEEAAKRTVEAMGGPEAVRARAEAAVDAGEYRWAAMLLNHAVFADPGDIAARDALAEVYTQLGFQAEAGTWRNIYLTGAQELRSGVLALPRALLGEDILAATETAMMLDVVAVRVNPEKAAARSFAINLELTDRGEQHLITVRNGVLIHEGGVVDPAAGATVKISRADLLRTLLGGLPLATAKIESSGDASLYGALVDLIEPAGADFAVATP